MSLCRVISISAMLLLPVCKTSEIPNCPAEAIIFTAQPMDIEIGCQGANTATFPCRYEGSTAHPRWIINSSTYPSLNSQLPYNHFYANANHTLTVINIVQRQNNTLYQCELLSINNGQLCSHKSTIGRLIVNCKAIGTTSVTLIWTTSSALFIDDTTAAAAITELLPSVPSIGTNITPRNEMSPKNASIFIYTSVISIGLLCFLIGTAVILTGLWCHKKNKSSTNLKQENIYDEPISQEPVYKNVAFNPTSQNTT